MSVRRFKIEKPYYPIVYVRGYAMRASERQKTFNDTYYGFSATSVEKRQAPPPQYFEADVFEGQLIRFMKMKDYGYADSVNRGGALKMIAAIEDPPVIAKILTHLGLPSRAPPRSPARRVDLFQTI